MQKPLLAFGAPLCLLFTLAGCKGDPSRPEYWGGALEHSAKAKDRVRVLENLRSSKHLSAAFLPLLHQQLASDKSAEVKAALAKALGDVKDPSSVQPLTDAIDFSGTDSSSAKMNQEIASALKSIGDARATPALLKLLKNRDTFTRVEAINGLGAIRAKEAVKPLVALAQDESTAPFILKKTLQALGNIGDASAIPVLTQFLFKEPKGASFYGESSFALYQIGKKSADAVLPILTGDDKATFTWASKAGLLEAALYAKAAQLIGDFNDPRGEKALLGKLGFKNSMLDVQLFVRMRAADALGRLRSKQAVPVLSQMLTEEEATARAEYARALVRIGDPAATPALLKVASKGSWEGRQVAMWGAANLGDGKTLGELEKLERSEEGQVRAACKEEPDDPDCKNVSALVKKHQGAISLLKARLHAAAQCQSDLACWAKKLEDKDAGVRERAAYQLGRSKDAKVVPLLMQKLTEPDLDARLAVISALDWLSTDSADAKKQAQPHLAALDAQIAKESGSTQYVRVNEDLRRLAVKLNRGSI